jgi:DNA-binding NtrC family response regulator
MKDKLVFVADDDRMIQNFLEYTIINREGYSVKVFSNAEDCILNLNLRPDIIVLDHYFQDKEKPLMSGLEAMVEVKKIDNSIPIIILSNSKDPLIIKSYYSHGALDFISKEGYFINQLFETLEKIQEN